MGLVFAAREPGAELAGLPVLHVGRLQATETGLVEFGTWVRFRLPRPHLYTKGSQRCKPSASTNQPASAGWSTKKRPNPTSMLCEVLVKVAACGITHNELDYPIWTCRAGHPRTSIIPGAEVSGVIAALGLGTAGVAVGEEVFGLTDQLRDGTAAEYVAVEARNLAPKPRTVDHVHAAALPRAGLTAWQALFDHGQLAKGQTVVIHGAAGAVGSTAVQLGRWAGAEVIGTGRSRPRSLVLDLGADRFVALDEERLQDAAGKPTWCSTRLAARCSPSRRGSSSPGERWVSVSATACDRGRISPP